MYAVKRLWCHAIDSIFAFFIFSIFFKSMVSLFLAWHDQYFIMFKDSNVFEFTIFHSEQSIIILICSVNSNYLFSKEEKQKKIVETILWVNLLPIY